MPNVEYTAGVEAALRAAEVAAKNAKTEVRPEHILYAFLQRPCIGTKILEDRGVNIDAMQATLEALLSQQDADGKAKAPKYNPLSRAVLRLAEAYARKKAHASDGHCLIVGTEHILYALSEQESEARSVLAQYQVLPIVVDSAV